MSNKILKIRRIFVWAIYNKLKQTPPKDYPTTGEIKSTISNILPALKEHVGEYLKNIEKAENLQEKLLAKEITDKEMQEGIEKINEGWKEYNKKSGNEIVEVSFDEEGFKTLKTQFEREGWGKQWVMNIDEFSELMEAFAEAGK